MAISNEKKTVIRLIGTGMGGKNTLTAEARSAIENADVLMGVKRVTEPFSELAKPIFNTWKAHEIAEIIRREKFERPCVLMSGDCGFYSAAQRLIGEFGKIPEFNVEVIPGISSPAYFAARIKKPWQDMKFVSLHGVENSIVRNVRRNKHCFFLLGGGVSAAHLCGRLCDYGLGEIKVFIGEDLGCSSEKIVSGTAQDFLRSSFGELCVLVTENPDFERGIPIGIPDEEFVRETVVRVPMTRSEVRAVIMSKLGIRDGDICWDIGCGTGSVTVEMALQCGSGHVYAADMSDAAADLTGKNLRKFGCDNALAYRADAPEILENFPAPDCVFIGGSCGKLPVILDRVFEAAKKNARIVLTAVTLDTLETARKEFKKHGIVPEIVQCAFTRVNGRSMMSAGNPVFVIKGIAE